MPHRQFLLVPSILLFHNPIFLFPNPTMLHIPRSPCSSFHCVYIARSPHTLSHHCYDQLSHCCHLSRQYLTSGSSQAALPPHPLFMTDTARYKSSPQQCNIEPVPIYVNHSCRMHPSCNSM